jgi:ParB/RepB/Spo0J family partition protein
LTTAIAEQPKKLSPPPIPADAGSPTVNIPVTRIVPSPWNRKADVDDLVESVRKNGVVQNVVVRPHVATEEDVALYCMKSDPFAVGDSIFQLVAGERRWGAAKKAGRSHVPAAIRKLSDIDAMDFQIDENENRKNLRPMERAEAYDRLRMLYQEAHAKDKDYTEAKAIEAVAASRNCSSRTVYDIISLKKLTQNVQHALRNGEMETSHGVVLAGRSPEDQEKLLLWMRQQTHHSQGDIPAVRRLKLEIRTLDVAAEDRKRQEKLFKEGEQSSAPPKGLEAARWNRVLEAEKKLEATCGQAFYRVSTDPESSYVARTFLKAGTWKEVVPGTCRGVGRGTTGSKAVILDGPRAGEIITACQGRGMLACEKHWPELHPKPPTAAELKRQEQQRQKEAKAEEKRREKQAKAERERERNARIDKTYDAAFFQSLATKAHVCSRMLTHVVPNLIFNLWENQLPIEAFAQTVLGWPAPKDGNEYSYNEVKAHCVKHTRKFGAKGVLPAMLITLFQTRLEQEKLAKYFGVDPKKLRKQAAAQIAEEERKARLPKEPTTQKEKWLHAALHHVSDADKRWAKLRRTRASDKEIRAALGAELGLGGSCSGGDLGNGVAFIGGQNPVVFFNSSTWSRSKKPSLQGAALVAAVRDLLKIPEKGDVDA